MESAQDCVGIGKAPARSHNPVASLFFVAYIILVAFFMLNVFVGYVITTFRCVAGLVLRPCALQLHHLFCKLFFPR